ncbi:MAG: hypothetical protein MW690_000040 [Methanophagales archaeon]|nr:hypothetical protein [Methanophagales archaeon]
MLSLSIMLRSSEMLSCPGATLSSPSRKPYVSAEP